jgi:hypothetical protein
MLFFDNLNIYLHPADAERQARVMTVDEAIGLISATTSAGT